MLVHYAYALLCLWLLFSTFYITRTFRRGARVSHLQYASIALMSLAWLSWIIGVCNLIAHPSL